MIRVAVDRYGTVGKRVVDATVEVVGTSGTHPLTGALVAAARRYPLPGVNGEPGGDGS